MANLYVDGIAWGGVISEDYDQVFPAMDSKYREVHWTITYDRAFSDYTELLNYEENTIQGYFVDREKDVSYAAITEYNMRLLEIKRVRIITPKAPARGEYRVIFVKEEAP